MAADAWGRGAKPLPSERDERHAERAKPLRGWELGGRWWLWVNAVNAAVARG